MEVGSTLADSLVPAAVSLSCTSNRYDQFLFASDSLRTVHFADDELAVLFIGPVHGDRNAIMDAYRYLFGSINILVSLPSCDSHTTLARCMQRGFKSIFPGHNSAGTCPFLLCSETLHPSIASTANREENPHLVKSLGDRNPVEYLIREPGPIASHLYMYRQSDRKPR